MILMLLEQITMMVMLAIVLVSPLLNVYFFVRSLKHKNQKVFAVVVSLILYCLFLFLLFLTFAVDM